MKIITLVYRGKINNTNIVYTIFILQPIQLQPDNQQAEVPPHDNLDTNREPYGRTQYSFEDAPEVNLPEVSRSPEVLNLAKQITKKYSEVVKHRRTIKRALTASAELLGLSVESAELSSYFQALKQPIAKESMLLLKREQGEPLRITADENALTELMQINGWHHALRNFNSALASSFMLLNMKEDAGTFIQSKLEEMGSPTHSQTRESQDLYKTVRNIPRYLDDFAAEIEKFLHDVNVAGPYLAGREITGLIGSVRL